MAAPNLLAPTTITGKITGVAISNSATVLLSNASSSGKLLRISSVIISNITSSAATITIDLYKNQSTAYRMPLTKTIPANDIWAFSDRDLLIQLEENDSLRATGSATSTFEAVISYEDIS